MQAFVASLTAATLFIHTVVGCCWHHAHGCDHAAQAGAAPQSTECCHHQHQSDSTPHHMPGKCQIDCEGSCHFVAPQKVTIEAPQWSPLDLVAVLPSLAIHQLAAASPWQAAPPLLDLAPPLRTHLLHQVLLN